MDFIRQTILVATIGGQPQVVTFALDDLLSRGIAITQLILIHFASDAPRLQQSMQKVVTEIEGPRYADRSLRLTLFPVATNASPLSDIRDEADAHLAWEAINQLIIDLKEARHTLHVCISGGRRMLGLMTISVAMLHFGHQDVLWHMYTPDEWLRRSQDGAMMHLPSRSGFMLIRVPMMPWGSYFPALRQLTRPALNEPDVLAAPRQVLDYAEEAKRTAVVKQLTERQKEVLQAFAQGLTPQEVAERLFISVKTVDSHKTVILAECRNAWNLPEETWLDYRFLAEKFDTFSD
ncbi:MAG: CRISPR-associated ring nuclease [Chloroflexota bacterium]